MTEEIKYKNWQDPNLLFAADESLFSLRECIRYCDYILKKCADNPEFRSLITYAGDFDYDKEQAKTYIESLNKAKITIGDANTSTPQQRHDARMLIAQVYSWCMKWKAGDPLRWHIYRLDQLPPNCYDAYMYTSPGVIPTIQVPGDVFPGYDPFADS